ncbi:MAG TPA: hypothetical protein VKR79_00820 [Gaiellaceae bacterium]|nr:hypothetical protein [Gaiellaceae bacterium]
MPTVEKTYAFDPLLAGSTADLPEETSTGTRPASRMVSRFGVALLPVAAAAAFVAGPIGERIRFTYARGGRSRTTLANGVWFLDDWMYSEEPAAIAEVRMLNELLALDAPEGFRVEFPE